MGTHNKRNMPIGMAPETKGFVMPREKAIGREYVTAAVSSVVISALLTTGLIVMFGQTSNKSAYAVNSDQSHAQQAVVENETAPTSEAGPFLPIITQASKVSASSDSTEKIRKASTGTVNASSTGTAVSSTSSAPGTSGTSGKWTPIEALAGEGSSSSPQRIWHDAWIETIVHPAIVETVEAYDSYVCDTCGFETLDLSEMEAHLADRGHAGYTTVYHEEKEYVVEEEWTEEIYHEGYWE